MKVTVDEQKKASADEYPKLMKSRFGFFVLFKSYGVGTVVGSNLAGGVIQPPKIGDQSDGWVMYDFTDFHGTITLEND